MFDTLRVLGVDVAALESLPRAYLKPAETGATCSVESKHTATGSSLALRPRRQLGRDAASAASLAAGEVITV